VQLTPIAHRNQRFQLVSLPLSGLSICPTTWDPSQPLNDPPDMRVDREAIPLERTRGSDNAGTLETDARKGNQLRFEVVIRQAPQVTQGFPATCSCGYGPSKGEDLLRPRRSEATRMDGLLDFTGMCTRKLRRRWPPQPSNLWCKSSLLKSRLR